jgi:hypothetical protein
MTASSSATIVIPSQDMPEVCLSPVSPLTQYATGRADRTGMRVCLVPIRTVRISVRATEATLVPWMISRDTSSGMSSCASERRIASL